MAMKSTVLITILVVVLVVAQAKAQSSGLTALAVINGVVSCSVNASVNGTTQTPPFPNALVQLSCGGRVIASALTNATGGFTIDVSPLQLSLANILTSCRLIVASPLSNCNAALPSTGFLQSTLESLGLVIEGFLSILRFVPTGFVLNGI